MFFTGPDNVKNKVYSKQDFENYLTTISKPNPFTGAGGSSSTTVSPAKRLYIELQKYKKAESEDLKVCQLFPSKCNIVLQTEVCVLAATAADELRHKTFFAET